jgi:hypothetical protein
MKCNLKKTAIIAGAVLVLVGLFVMIWQRDVFLRGKRDIANGDVVLEEADKKEEIKIPVERKYPRAKDLDLSLEVDSVELVPYQPLNFNVVLRNVTKEPTKIPGGISSNWRVLGSYQHGPFLNFALPPGSGDYRTSRILQSGASELFPGDLLLLPNEDIYVFAKPGKYIIKAEMALPRKSDEEVKSAGVILVVRVPTESDAGAARLLMRPEATRMFNAQYTDQGAKLLEEIVDQHADSVLADYACFTLGLYFSREASHHKDDASAMRAYRYWEKITKRVPRLWARGLALRILEAKSGQAELSPSDITTLVRAWDENPELATAVSREFVFGAHLPKYRDELETRALVEGGDLPPLIERFRNKPGGLGPIHDAMKKMGPKAARATAFLKEKLKDASGYTRIQAAYGLFGVDPENQDTMPALVRELTNRDPLISDYAMVAVRAIGSSAETAVPALINLAAKGEERTRLNAISALGNIGKKPDEAIPVLVKIAGEKGSTKEIRAAVALALGGYGPQARTGLPTLVDLLKDEDKIVRWRAAGALMDMGGEAKPALRALIGALLPRAWRPAWRTCAGRARGSASRPAITTSTPSRPLPAGW